MKVKLTKVKSTHNNVRTKTFVGEITKMPKINEQIFITNGFRYIASSFIVEVKKNKKSTTYKTLNSTYRIEKL